MNFGSDECTEILYWCETSLLSQAVFEACGIRRFHLCARDHAVLYSDKNEEIYMALFRIKNFQVLLKRKLQHVGHTVDCSVGQCMGRPESIMLQNLPIMLFAF